MFTVTAHFEDGAVRKYYYDTMAEAIAAQEKLVFELGVDAEVE